MLNTSAESAHLILIDDDEPTQAYLTTTLSRRGYIVHQAMDPSHGFDLLQHLNFPAVVILNFKMQSQHGNFIELVRNTSLEYQPYILVLLDAANETDITSAYEAGADDYLLQNAEARVLGAKLSAAERAIDLQLELYDRNRQLEDRTLSLERTLDLAGVVLFEEDFRTEVSHIIFEPEIAPNFPFGRDNLLSSCIDEINRERVELLSEINQPLIFEVTGPAEGGSCWVEQKTLRRIHDDDTDEEIGRLSIARDVSSYYRVAAQRDTALRHTQSALDELEQTQIRQARMFAVIGHELRTPLAAMRMIADESGLMAELPQGELFDRLLDQTLEILSNLKSVTNPQVESSEHTEVTTVSDIVQEAIASLSSLLSVENFALNLDLSNSCSEPHRIRLNALRRVLINLIKNAALHSEGSQIWVDVRSLPVDKSQSLVSIDISDNGKGIPLKDIDQLFEPFVRGNTEREGAGLGLMIVRSLVESMGGNIKYQRRYGAGSHFSISLPIERLSEENEGQIQPESSTQQTTGQFSGVNVLLAENIATMNQLTTKALQRSGAEVFSVLDGEQALAIYQQQKFDVVVTDLFMPKLNGIELTRALRSLGFDGLIVGLTAATLGEETRELIAAGADSALEKPLTNSLLLEIIKLHWRKRNQQLDNQSSDRSQS